MSASLPFKDDVERWSVEQVAAWHQQKEMPEAADIYLRQGIDGHQMLTLPESKLVALFWEFSVRKRADIINIINEIKNQPTIPHRKSHAARYSNQIHKKCSTPQAPQSLRMIINTSVNNNGGSCYDLEESKDIPYADETSNEDYLVPLSAGGAMVVMTPPPPPSRALKKERCPSPRQNILKEKNRIQDKELPKPPSSLVNTSQQLKLTNSVSNGTEDIKVLHCFPNGTISERSLMANEEERTENREDLNAYEIINENPTEIDGLKLMLSDSKETLTRPPDLPNRNSIPFATTSPSAGNSMAPIVPPRTKSAVHQKPNSFHQAVRNGSRTPVVLPPSKEMKPLLSNSSVVLHQSTPLPEPPNIAGVAFTSKKGVGNGGSAKKIISHPILNSSTISALQQPLQLINISSMAAKKATATASTGMLPKSRLSVSNLPQVKTLDLGGGKSVPMNSLYESLLQESYFHPVVRNVLPKLLTKDRLFLVRPSTHSQHPLTLSLQEKAKIFNISIRMRKDAKYALGTEKPGEMSFSTVGEMIEWHRREPIKLEDGSLTYLTWTPAKSKPIIVHK